MDTNEQKQDLIPDMPSWFKSYLQGLPNGQKNELFGWINCGDDSAVMETLQEAIS